MNATPLTVPRTRELGTTGAQVSVIGQGTANLHRAPRHQAIAALRRGIELGLTHIDTAELYEVEDLVGEAIAGRREQVFLTSKVLPEHAGGDGLRRACEASLRRLGTDRLDLYLLHAPSQHPLEPMVAGFEALVRDGKIRFWGVSNFDAVDLARVIALAPDRVACNQVLYRLGARWAEHDLAELCAHHRVGMVGFSPFGGGRLSSAPPSVARVLDEIARAHGATPWQVALAFLTRLDGTFAIPKAVTLAHVEANARRLALAPSELARLDAALPRRWSAGCGAQ